jgi:hypothetical protein
MSPTQQTTLTVMAFGAALALPMAPWAFIPLGLALLLGWDAL